MTPTAAPSIGIINALNTVHAARRAITVVRAVLMFTAIATVVVGWVNATDDSFGLGDQTSGKQRLSQFLNATSLPLLLVAAVLLATVFASVYIERLLIDLNRADDEISGSAIDGSGPLTVDTANRSLASTRSVEITPTIDDSAWRPPTR